MAVTEFRERPPLEVAASKLAEMEDKFAAALPAHIPAERFVRVALSAIINPSVAKIADSPKGRKSIFDACLKAASDGLLLDGREAALVPQGDVAAYQPMVAGIMKKARNSGEIASIVSQVVYENDEFEINYVTDGAPIVHKPALSNRGAAIGAYAIARLRDGSWTQPEFMSKDEIEHVRKNFSKQANGLMWTKSWGEAARKTVIKKAAKYWPSSTDKDGHSLQDLIDHDNSVDEVEFEQAPPAPAIKQRNAARLLADDGDTHDPETGEVTSDSSAAADDVADV